MKQMLLSALLLLSSCSTVAIKAKPVVFTPVTVPDPKPMVLNHTTWIVYNANDIKNLAKTLTSSNSKNFVLYGLDNQNFQVLDANVQEMYRYILEETETANFYKNLELKEHPTEPAKK